MAQTSLGHVKKARGVTVADMTDYFGKDSPEGATPGRGGRSGVLRMKLYVGAPGTSPKVDHEQTVIIGMNSEIKNMVAKHIEPGAVDINELLVHWPLRAVPRHLIPDEATTKRWNSRSSRRY